MRRWLPWGALLVVVVAGLAVAALRSSSRPTPTQRAAAIAGEVRCPVCAGQSAELSDAPAAAAVRSFILQQVEAGQGRGAIEQELADRYGSDILLRPPASGLAALVWVLPVAAFLVAAGGLAAAFRRWRSVGSATATEADRERVARERAAR